MENEMTEQKVDRTPRAAENRASKPRRKPWQPPSMLDAPADEYPEFEAPTMDAGKYEGVFGVGGLLLARIPIEIVEDRTSYFQQQNADAMQAVDNDLMKETQHHSMAIQKPERQSRVTFGGPKTDS
jgi:hypothetical protein